MTFEDYQAITRLINEYPNCADKGDFDGVATLLADCVQHLPGGEIINAIGHEKYLEWYTTTIKKYPDSSTPKTRRLVGTVNIEDDGADLAKAQYYIICFQATDQLPLQPIIAGTIYDKFAKHDGNWKITERREDLELVGNMSHHVNNFPEPDIDTTAKNTFSPAALHSSQFQEGYLCVFSIPVVSGQVDYVLNCMTEAASHSVHEDGLLSYEFARDPNNPDAIIVVDLYKNKAAYEQHLLQPHARALSHKIDPFIAAMPTMNFYDLKRRGGQGVI